jgi:hypothetical protein
MNEQPQYSPILARIPQELQPFDERHGTAKVGVAELRAAVDWLVSKGMADSRLKAALRRKAVAHG